MWLIILFFIITWLTHFQLVGILFFEPKFLLCEQFINSPHYIGKTILNMLLSFYTIMLIVQLYYISILNKIFYKTNMIYFLSLLPVMY